MGDSRDDALGRDRVHPGEREQALERDLALRALVRREGGGLELAAGSDGDLAQRQRALSSNAPQDAAAYGGEPRGGIGFDACVIPLRPAIEAPRLRTGA